MGQNMRWETVEWASSAAIVLTLLHGYDIVEAAFATLQATWHGNNTVEESKLFRKSFERAQILLLIGPQVNGLEYRI